MAAQGALIGEGAVQQDDLVAVTWQQARTVDDGERHHDEAHEHGDQWQRGGLDATEQADGEGREEVGDLALGDLRRTQADDGQDPEEAEAQARSHRGGGQQESDCEDADVDADVGSQEVLTPVTWQVEGADEDREGDEIDADIGERGQAHGRTPRVVVVMT